MISVAAMGNEMDAPAAVAGNHPAAEALCFVLVDDPAIGWLLTTALFGFGITAERFTGVTSMLERVAERPPEMIFLDLFVGEADVIDILRELGRMAYGGEVQIMSSGESTLFDDVRRVGARL